MKNNYTELLNIKMSSLHQDYLDGSSCSERDLLNYLSENFHPFSEGITRFIGEYVPSFNGNLSKISDVCSFIESQYKDLQFSINDKTIHNWFYKNAFPAYTQKGRRSMYALCFSFGFDLEITRQFFRKVYLDRCFDCHNIEEAVYYYCFKNNYTYADALSILAKCPELTKESSIEGSNIIFTRQIQNRIDNINSPNELIDYFKSNLPLFINTKQSAFQIYTDLMSEIAVPKDAKKHILSLIKDKKYKDIPYLTILDHCASEHFDDLSDETYLELKQTDISSASFIMKQILGFDITSFSNNEESTRYYNNRLNDKEISKLPSIVRQNFPSQNKLYLEKNWEKASYETLRKLIILLYFYKFCVECKLEWKALYKLSPNEYSEYFIHQVNSRLHSAGFEDLYLGNPYDWIFIFSSKTEDPLDTFRCIYYSSIVDEDDEEW